MSRKYAALALALVGALLVACRGGGGGGAAPVEQMLPAIDRDLAISAVLPKNTIGEELPSEGLGSIDSKAWHAAVGGFTQESYSQTLAFPPGTRITIRNLSKTTPHTLNVIAVLSRPPARFPADPKLSFTPEGHGKLAKGYASGTINPGKSVTVTLEKGIYLIGCAFHYKYGMRDVLVVEPGAKPGPQASPPASPKPSPTSSGGGGWNRRP
jgi:plastocyanin